MPRHLQVAGFVDLPSRIRFDILRFLKTAVRYQAPYLRQEPGRSCNRVLVPAISHSDYTGRRAGGVQNSRRPHQQSSRVFKVFAMTLVRRARYERRAWPACRFGSQYYFVVYLK
jgi:hypothetical protein